MDQEQYSQLDIAFLLAKSVGDFVSEIGFR